MAPDVSVIVVNFNGQRYLETCLNALEQQDLECEIVLVDNASEDDSVAFVRERFPAVRLVELDRNLGFAGGNNAGARAASGRYLAFLNNDTRVAPSWLGALRRAIDGTPDVGFVTSRVVYMHNPSVIDSAGDCLTRSGGAFKRGHGAPSERLARPLEVFGACGAACLFRREVFEAAGGFDEDFFLSHEDVDLSYRARLLGYRCQYVPDAVVAHAGSATLGRVSAQAVFSGQRNSEWLYLQNTPWPLLLRTLPGHLVYDATAAVYFGSIGLGWPFLCGKWAALKGAGLAWRKRRAIQRTRRASSRAIWEQLEPRWIGRKLGEKRFDLAVRGEHVAFDQDAEPRSAGGISREE